MKIYFFIVLFLAVAIDQSLQQNKCHNDKLVGCVYMLTNYAKENASPFPRNAEEIKVQCKYLEDMRNCAYNYSKKCMTELEKSLGQLFLAGTVQSMKDICDPNHRLNKDFLKNAHCIDEQYGGTKKCFEDAFAAIEELEEVKSTERVRFLCCGINRFRTCLATHFESACNKEVVEFIDKILEFVATEFALKICENYSTHGKGCPELPSGVPLKGTYKNNLLGDFLSPFYRE